MRPVLMLATSCFLLGCGGQPAAEPATEPPPVATTPAPVPARQLRCNDAPLSAEGLAVLEQLERATGVRLPDGSYWYDPACGAFGAWGGPTLTFVPAGLPLAAGPLPANASGGGTGVFTNGRELHAFDLAYLQHLVGPIAPGRYFTDAQGNAGLEGGPVLVNLVLAAQQRGGFASYSSNPHAGTRSSISSEGVSFTNSTGKTVSWYPGLGSSTSE